MASYNEIVAFTKGIGVRPISFTNADGTTAKQTYAPADPASRINFLAISSTSASQKYMIMQLHNLISGEIAPMGTITIPAGAGTNGSVPIVSGLNRGNLPWLQIDSDGNPFIDLNFNMNLEMKLLSGLTSGETITVTTSGGSYAA
ncbi:MULTISPECIES: hypothetical protein [unclassified Mucilaginibacter]|uniref:hypothetical protein n=1 Tax=unclassified Mucilaginibacter TaxID=2617802 RepID=UPI002AC91C2E|nr:MULTISPECIES: hypothetical protein [unclassified Mucilaginibacter]MEB0280617.1 hypothetical protein [Mucilaginibacter sp. 10B2]MEB0300290.1 hypothetical protein [Mucilaginibacter sp. 5C4]WPX24965.1 hypothetical protein RHM67_06780 [Mucilaginibacter sp. 5C4]